jgi:hypothetical protein
MDNLSSGRAHEQWEKVMIRAAALWAKEHAEPKESAGHRNV